MNWIEIEGQDILLYLAKLLEFLVALVVLNDPACWSGAFCGHCGGAPRETLSQVYASSLG